MGRLGQLRYAVNDANDVEQYLRTCWKPAELNLVRIKEEEATAAALEAGLTSLAKQGPYDLCWIFMSGHGWVDNSSAGLIVQPSEGGERLPLLDVARLDRLLSSVIAERTILVLDCCFAEGLVRHMKFFDALEQSVARLYVASSREKQRTWEDDGIERGVFTAHLIDLLNTGSSASFGGRKERVDVDAELFPALCEQVPLYVYEHKNGEHQEPVKGGIARAAVTLPVANTAQRVQGRTILGTVLRRLRQIAIGVVATGVALLLFAYALLYYVEPGATGTLLVRHGIRSLEPLLRFLPLDRIDTGIAVANLSRNPAASAPLQSGYTSGVWTHVADYRTWFTAVLAGLDPAAAAHYSTLAGDVPPALGSAPSPLDIERAAWMALSAGDPHTLDGILSHVPGMDRRSRELVQLDVNHMDFEVLDLSPANMESYAAALSYSATLAPIEAFPAFLGFAKATQEWLVHNTDAQRGRGARDRVLDSVADILRVISIARIDRGLVALDEADRAHLRALADLGYFEVIGLALSRLPADSEARLEAATDALKRFHGNADEPAQGIAFRTILASLDASAGGKALVADVAAVFAQSGSVPNSYHTHFLIGAADARALPTNLVDELIVSAKAASQKSELDFEDSELARVLAHAMSQIPDADRAVAYGLIERAANSVTPRSMMTAEMYGVLGRQLLDTDDMLAKVRAQAFAAAPYTPDDSSTSVGPTPGVTIVVGAGPWLVALAEFGRTRKLSSEDIAVLRRHVANPNLREFIAPALLYQEHQIESDNPVPSWTERFAALRTDARGRDVEQAIFVADLAIRPRSQFDVLLDELRRARSDTQEPELRISLGVLIVESQIARTKRSASDVWQSDG
ncbi:caspase family protein [Rhizobium ruizarguesonis]